MKNDISKVCDACGVKPTAANRQTRERHDGLVLVLCVDWRECVNRFR